MRVARGSKTILFRGHLVPIEEAAEQLDNTINNITAIDRESKTYTDVLQHWLCAIAPEKVNAFKKTRGKDTSPDWRKHPFYFDETSEGAEEIAANWQLFFETLPEETLSLRQELLLISPMAIRYIPVEEERRRTWYATAIQEHPLALRYIPASELTSELCDLAITLDPETIQFIEKPTLDQQFYVVKKAPMNIGYIQNPHRDIVATAIFEQSAEGMGSVAEYIFDSTDIFRCIPEANQNAITSLYQKTLTVFREFASSDDGAKSNAAPFRDRLQGIIRLDILQKVKRARAAILDYKKRVPSGRQFLKTSSVTKPEDQSLIYREKSGEKRFFASCPAGVARTDWASTIDEFYYKIDEMPFLSVWVGPGKNDYAPVLPNEKPAPGDLGKSGVNGIDLYVYKETKKASDRLWYVRALDLTVAMTSGPNYHYKALLKAMLLGAANIIDDINFLTGMPKHVAEGIIKKIREKKNTYGNSYYEELRKDGLVAVYRTRSCLDDIVNPSYECVVEFVMNLPGTAGYTHATCLLRDKEYNAIWKNERGGATDAYLSFLTVKAMTAACTQITYTLFGPVRCCASATDHYPVHITEHITSNMSQNPFETALFPREDWKEKLSIAPKDFVFNADLPFSSLGHKHMDAIAPFFIDALYLTAVHVTGLCGCKNAGEDEMNRIVGCAREYWRTITSGATWFEGLDPLSAPDLTMPAAKET